MAGLLLLAANCALAAEVTITRLGDQVVLSWPQASTNDYYVQAAANLSAPVGWTNMVDPATNGDHCVVTNQITETSQFYRLQSWEVLFDGTNVSALRASPTNAANSFPSNSWVVTNGALATKVVANPVDLITKATYQNFELRWKWKTDPNGNSGVFYREGVNPEYQLLDDVNRRNAAPYNDATKQMAAVFGYIAPTNKILAPTGQWNDCKVRVQDYHAQHWLNGRLVVDYLLNDPSRTNAFTQATNTHIIFQNIGNSDYGVVPGAVYYQDIKIRRLP